MEREKTDAGDERKEVRTEALEEIPHSDGSTFNSDDASPITREVRGTDLDKV